MKFKAHCECCGDENEIEIKDDILIREYNYCVNCAKSDKSCHRWHDFIVTKEEVLLTLYPELNYKLGIEKKGGK